MAIELWGTFSVRDHLVERAFVADVLLYDRLVIPTFAGDEPEDAWLGWELPKQRKILEQLGDLAIPIPWTRERRKQWQVRFDAYSAQERRQARGELLGAITEETAEIRSRATDEEAYYQTRLVLSDYINSDANERLIRKIRATKKLRPGAELQAVTAYPDPNSFRAEVLNDRAAVPPTAAFGWQFFVPESAERGEDEDRRLLDQAIKLATDSEFIENRQQFYGWCRDVQEERLSPEDAREDIEERLTKLQAFLRRQLPRKVARYAIKVADVAAGGLATSEGTKEILEAVFGASEVVDDLFEAREPTQRLKVAAIFKDARRRFHWKAPADERRDAE